MNKKEKYNVVLTVILILIILSFLTMIGYAGYNFYDKYAKEKEAQKAIEEFDKLLQVGESALGQNLTEAQEEEQNTENGQTSGSSKNSSNKNKVSAPKVNGYDVAGKIEIPKIKLTYPVLAKLNEQSIEYSVSIVMGPGLNKVGNTSIIGHNYRNGLFFSDLKKVQLNDKIYITDETGQKIEYIIYNKYVTTPEDGGYLIRETAGKREISLQTCMDNPVDRLIIWAREN